MDKKKLNKIKKWFKETFNIILGFFAFLFFMTKFKKIKSVFTDLSKIEVKTNVKSVKPKHKKITDI